MAAIPCFQLVDLGGDLEEVPRLGTCPLVDSSGLYVSFDWPLLSSPAQDAGRCTVPVALDDEGVSLQEDPSDFEAFNSLGAHPTS